MGTTFFDIPDDLWDQIAPLLPKRKVRSDRRGRPWIADRMVLAGIVYHVKTGCQWKALPPMFGSGSTCHRRMQEWRELGVFRAIFEKLVRFYDTKKGLQWKWASMDAIIVKAPKGGSSRARTLRIGPRVE